MSDRTPVLVTFAPMIDSELARLVLRHHQVDYREAAHLFGWGSVIALAHGGYGRVPMLHGIGKALNGPLAIAAHYDARAPSARRLIPPDEPLAGVARTDADGFNRRLGFDVAVFSYYHLLPARDLMEPIFAAPLPPGEARALRMLYTPTRLAFQLLLRLDSGHAADALRRIMMAFDRTAERVADGRPYLAGDRCTLGDLALLASLTPLLDVPGHEGQMPAVAAMPDAFRTAIEPLRRHPTARFVRSLYDMHFL